ncbi:MAG TPA: hypothetical protein VIQ97_01225 [Prevotella sp.]
MKKLLFLLIAGMAMSMAFVSSCKYAPKQELGDTVAASVFDIYDTARVPSKKPKNTLAVADSVGLFVIGEGSTRQLLQLLSYPSRRDTAAYGKGRHIKVVGSAQIGNVVRAKFYVLPSGDSIVTQVEQVKLPGEP